ncbi:MAG: plastocyanin/azurin family copper-binding protein [Nitrososphaeraceae archaeon]
MVDWDLLTPGIGLTSLGIVGVLISLSGIAKTFIDGMHAVSLLTFLIGMIFLSVGIFKDGFPSSKKAKSAAFITLGILIIIGLIGAFLSSLQTPSVFIYIGIILLISIPATAVVIGIYKKSTRIKIYLSSFVVSVIIGIISLSTLAGMNPEADSNEDTQKIEIEETQETNIDTSNTVKVDILAGSSAQGNPDYSPDELIIKDSVGITWTNVDNAPHTVTSFKDDGKSFDSSIINSNETYTLMLSDLKEKEYEYFCTIHPYMKATFKVE